MFRHVLSCSVMFRNVPSLSGTIFPDLLLIRRVSKQVGEDGRGNGGEEGFVD